MKNLVSIIIRTLNEERYLQELLLKIKDQKTQFDLEVILVDSGSIDKTISIAKSHNVKIVFIDKKSFSYGRSLNLGCKFSNGQYLVFISGHCIPTSETWLQDLVLPIHVGTCHYTYGRQLARDTTKFSEKQIFLKHYPENSQIPQEGFFCNNANAALLKSLWQKNCFNEELTGCEDMELAKRLRAKGNKIGYVAKASVFHIHNETWKQVKTRYEREAFAIQSFMPEVQLSKLDVLIFFYKGVINDLKVAFFERSLFQNIGSIIMFRWAQYYGAYIGNRSIRVLSQKMKEKYYYS
jgi:glycosyltransferase involved in cell wall biosynthesis